VSKSTKDTLAGIVGAILIFAVVAVAVSSCSGCAAPAAADDSRVKSAAEAGIDALGDNQPQESAAPPVEIQPPASITEPHIEPEPVKYFPPDEPKEPTIAVRFFTAASCAPCVLAEREINRFNSPPMNASRWSVGDWEPGTKRHIHIVRWEKSRDQFELYGVNATPTYVMTVDGKEIGRREGRQTAEQVEQWIRVRYSLLVNAPEVATQRPFAEPWRQELLRKHGRQAIGAHTDLETAMVALPETRINLRQQCVEFSGPSRVSQLNRWFSVSFGAGNVSHSGSTVEFSNPPELRFHLFKDRAGEKLDSLKAIEFVDGGVSFDLVRFGRLKFKVK
jgi:hypothetical protein